MRIRFTCLLAAAVTLAGSSLAAQTTWLINNLTNIGGYAVGRFGNPQVISTPYGNAVWFDGINAGLVVSNNPLGGMTNFTVEMLFRHDPSTHPTSTAPRIVHIQASPTDHRLTLETRVSTNVTPHTFVLDTFLKFGGATGYSLTLSNANFPHPVGWAHMAITYDGALFKNYVNGQQELSGAMNGTTFTNTGSTWIGQRSNNTNYFEGAVLALRFTPRVLSPIEFTCTPQTMMGTPVVSNGQAQLDFNLTSGLPLGFKLLQGDQPGGPWGTNADAVLTTNSPGVSYRFTAPAGGTSQFYRTQFP